MRKTIEARFGADRYGRRTIVNVLRVKGTRYRHGVGLEGGVPFAYGLCTVMAANPGAGTGAEVERNEAADVEHEVETGDLVRIEGVTYEVDVYRREYVRLVPV
jgi:hypothetical protein